jgi:hypothetical protein
MFTREIQADIYSGPVVLQPRFLRIPDAVKYSGIGRARLCELVASGQIKSSCIKAHKCAQRGIRLIDRESIDEFILASQSDGPEA